RRTPLPDDVLKAFNIFVTCQNNDELTYTYPLGPDNIVIGSDYGHYDGSSQMDATLIMRQRTDIEERVKRKILCDNAKRLWGLGSGIISLSKAVDERGLPDEHF